ncbi:collagen alpha-1(I) chain-like [Phyllostomus discolor]|uniref:Collagen alpha-1(I) chain-like n=1 Tax=Phyllostomus discolor TaxID=89673 RepID=A0A7E6DCP3_9CHIR|nr:collagen alpha-1(I) chain-like [Phyllostomus discolor]
MGGGGGRGGGGSVGRSGRAGGRGGVGWGGGRERRRGARGLWRARAPRLEKEEEPGPGGGLPRFQDVQGPPPAPGAQAAAPRAPAASQPRQAAGAPVRLERCTLRGRSRALAPPGTAPRGGPPGLPGGPEVPRGLPHTHTGPSSTDIRGIRQREVSLIAGAICICHSFLHTPCQQDRFLLKALRVGDFPGAGQ